MNHIFFRILAITVISSILMSACSADSRQQITISDAVIPAVGGTQTATLILDRAQTGLSGYTITISVMDEGKARIKSWTGPAWADMKSSGDLPGSQVEVQAAALTPNKVPTGSTAITLGTMVIEGISTGTTTIHATLHYLDDNHGGDYIPTTDVIDGSVTIKAGAGTTVASLKIPWLSYPPKDPDGDGLYEDIDGDGVTGFSDITAYFNNFNWIAENEPVSLFDFNRNGKIDFGDIIFLNQEQ